MEAQWKPKLPLAMVLLVGSLFFLVSRLHGSLHCLLIASNRPLSEYNGGSFLHAILCYHKSTDSVTFSIDLTSRAYGSISIVCGGGGTTVIKCMRERLKPGPFSSSSGLGMRLGAHLPRHLLSGRGNGMSRSQEF